MDITAFYLSLHQLIGFWVFLLYSYHEGRCCGRLCMWACPRVFSSLGGTIFTGITGSWANSVPLVDTARQLF